MRKFDLEAAINGEKLVTRNGEEVTEFHYFKTSTNSLYPCRAVIEGTICGFTIEGKY